MTLNELSARAMGWKLEGQAYFTEDGKQTGRWNIKPDQFGNRWSPSTCTDDALLLLEKVCPDGWTMEYIRPNNESEGKYAYYCASHIPDEHAHEKALALAMTLCALRAFGIPESELKE